MAAITLQGIVKNYGRVRAIHGIDLAIRDGEFVAFVGPSGCGKSTLLRMIAGLEEVTAGQILIGDRVVNAVEPRYRDIAMVFQDYALYPHMTVAENIGFGLKMRGTPRAEIAAAVTEAAEILQITPLLSRRPSELSGGQRQRVAMGRAIVRRPQAFLFDEPLSNLDAKLRVEMRTGIKRLHAMLGRTTIYVTHDQVEALTLADRVVVLKDGRLVQQGAPMELYTRPVDRFVAEFIGSPQMNMLPARIEGGCLRADSLAVAVVQAGEGEGRDLLLGVRPEDMIAVPAGEEDVIALVDVVEPVGSEILANCLLGRHPMTVRLSPDLDVAPGQRLPLRLRREKLHLFAADSGARIGGVSFG